MKRFLVGLLLALMTLTAVPSASYATEVTPAPGYYSWYTVHSVGGLKEAVNFQVKGDNAQFTTLRRLCYQGGPGIHHDFSGKHKAKGLVPVRDGVARKTVVLRIGGVKYTMSVRVKFATAEKATGWLRVQGGDCTGTKRKFKVTLSG